MSNPPGISCMFVKARVSETDAPATVIAHNINVYLQTWNESHKYFPQYKTAVLHTCQQPTTFYKG